MRTEPSRSEGLLADSGQKSAMVGRYFTTTVLDAGPPLWRGWQPMLAYMLLLGDGAGHFVAASLLVA